MKDPRIARLAGDAQEYAEEWSPYAGAEVDVDRAKRHVSVTVSARGPIHIEDGAGIRVSGHFQLAALDELLRDLQAARASLVKVLKGLT